MDNKPDEDELTPTPSLNFKAYLKRMVQKLTHYHNQYLAMPGGHRYARLLGTIIIQLEQVIYLLESE